MRRGRIALALAVAAVAGCGGATKTVTAPVRTVTAPPTTPTAPATTPTAPQPPSQTASTEEAQQYAQRTYVVQPSVGKRVFKVASGPVTVTASDGSTISAFDVVLADSGDGTGQAVLLFRGSQFLGWASNRLAIRLKSSASGNDVAVDYGDFQGSDPLCCPSSSKTVSYSWDGSRIVADGDPPVSYGKQGDQLHLSG